MKDYLLHTLSPEKFEELVIQICFELFGLGTICFSKGRDGGRDASFTGKANRFPSEESPWDGQFIVQAKSTSNPVGSCSDAEFLRLLRDEVPRIWALQSAGECDNYILFTNRKLSAHKEQELTTYLRKETKVRNIALLGKESITSYLSNAPSIVRNFHLVPRSNPIRPLNQIPPPVGDFTGRSILLDEIKAAVRNGIRIVGLNGMPGVGKTAIATKLAKSTSAIILMPRSSLI